MPRLLPLFLKISLPLIVLDQITKWWVVLKFRQPYDFVDGMKVSPSEPLDSITVVDNFFNIIRVHNQGVAFGFGNGSSWAPIVFLIVPFLALIIVNVMWRKNVFEGIAKWSAPLLLAGVLGNLIDRLFQGFWLKGIENESFWTRLSEGYVVDFLDIRVPFTNGYHWPSFNVADSCICIAAALLFLSAFRPENKENTEKEEKQAGE